jgi:poly(3-hydroxybutyrate) depolymerase
LDHILVLKKPICANLQKKDDVDPFVTAPTGFYDYGCTTVYACRKDPRFSYCLYVPPDYRKAGVATELVVVVHGSPRTFMDFRDRFQDLGAAHNTIILSPLFPIGVNGDGNPDGYKYMRESGARYDEILLAMVDEFGARYGVRHERFGMFGFSGGAQFVNRFLLLQPHRLWAASIAAPGSVTLVDDDRPWWIGTRDLDFHFGRALDTQALRKVALHLLVGEDDVDTVEITHREGGRYWMEEANHAGATRPQRLLALHRSLAAAGIPATLDVVPGMSHDAAQAIERAKAFLAAELVRRRAELSLQPTP